jgi:hypothetical protein
VPDAFQIWVTVCAPGHDQVTFHPFVGEVPLFVTVKPSWNPPLQELTSDQLVWQPGPGEVVWVGVGAGRVGVGAGLVGVGVGVGVGEWAVGVGVGMVGVGVGVGVGGGPPVPLVRTTTDSAGTETELPENVVVAMAGLALS